MVNYTLKNEKCVRKDITKIFSKIDSNSQLTNFNKINRKKLELEKYYEKNDKYISDDTFLKLHKRLKKDNEISISFIVGVASGILSGIICSLIQTENIPIKFNFNALENQNIKNKIIGLALLFLFSIITSVIIAFLFWAGSMWFIKSINKSLNTYENIHIIPYHINLIETILDNRILKTGAKSKKNIKVVKVVDSHTTFNSDKRSVNNWLEMGFWIKYYILAIFNFITSLSFIYVRAIKIKLLSERIEYNKSAINNISESYNFIKCSIEHRNKTYRHKLEKLIGNDKNCSENNSPKTKGGK